MFVFDMSVRSPRVKVARAESELKKERPVRKIRMTPTKKILRGEKMSNLRVGKIARNVALASAVIIPTLVNPSAVLARHTMTDRPLRAGDGPAVVAPVSAKFDEIGPVDFRPIVNTDTIQVKDAEGIFRLLKTMKPVNPKAPHVESNGIYAILNDGPQVVIKDRTAHQILMFDLSNTPRFKGVDITKVELVVDVVPEEKKDPKLGDMNDRFLIFKLEGKEFYWIDLDKGKAVLFSGL